MNNDNIQLEFRADAASMSHKTFQQWADDRVTLGNLNNVQL